MNTKPIPAIIMLLAGAAACVATYVNGYSLKDTLVILLIVLLVFLMFGFIIKKVLDAFHLPGRDAVSDEGEVVEKQNEEEGRENSEAREGSGGKEDVPETEQPMEDSGKGGNS